MKKKEILVFFLALFSWNANADWVTSGQNSKQYAMPLGTPCAIAKVDQSATGRVEYHNVQVKPGVAVPFPCKFVAAPVTPPPPPVTPPPPAGAQTPASIIASKQAVIAYKDPIDSSAKSYTVSASKVFVVTPTGCGSGCDGSLAKPFSPSQVRTTAAPGNLYLHRAGQYTGIFGGNWGNRNYILGAAQSGISLVCMPGEVCELISPSSNEHDNIILYDGAGFADNVTVAGFKLTGGGASFFGGGYGQFDASGKMIKGAKNVTLVGNTMSARYTGNSMTGIASVQGDGFKVIGNDFQNTGWTALYNNNHALYVQSGASNGLIEANTFHNLQLGHVIQVHQDGVAQTYTNVVIRRNKIIGANPMDTRGITVSNVDDASTILVEENWLENVGQNFSALSIYGGQVTAINNTFKDILGGDSGKIWLSDQYGHRPSLFRKGNVIIGGSGPDYGGVPSLLGNIHDLP